MKTGMKYIYTLVGLKAANIPVSPEKEFLHQYIRVNYGGHTVEEMVLAFDMAIQGKLEIDTKDVKHYENFSVHYFATIMNAFRVWSSQAYEQLKPLLEEMPKALPWNMPTPVSWRQELEDAYQHFLSFGRERWKYFPVGFYDQLVKDGALREGLHRRFMKLIRNEMNGEIIQNRGKFLNNIQGLQTQLQGGKFKGKDNEAAKRSIVKMTGEAKLTEIQQEQLNGGKRDGEIEVRSKQRVVIEFFQELKEGGFTTVYKIEEAADGKTEG